MSAIFHKSDLPSFIPGVPAFSFYEQRVAEELFVNPCFVRLGSGWWGYYEGIEAEIHMPSWDKGYDWDSAYRTVKQRHHLW